MYDVWLLLEGKQRKEFNYELFMQRFPGWEDHIQKKYKPPGSDNEDSTPRASKRGREETIDSSHEETVQEAAVRSLQEKKQRLHSKRQCTADSSDDETPKEAAAGSQLQEQNQDDLESSPPPKATEQSESSVSGKESSKGELKPDTEKSNEGNTKEDASMSSPSQKVEEHAAFELVMSMKIDDHHVDVSVAPCDQENVPSSDLSKIEEDYDPWKTLIALSGGLENGVIQTYNNTNRLKYFVGLK